MLWLRQRFGVAGPDSRAAPVALEVEVMRCLSQMRYHIDTALKWTAEGPEVGALTEHTLQQVIFMVRKSIQSGLASPD